MRRGPAIPLKLRLHLKNRQKILLINILLEKSDSQSTDSTGCEYVILKLVLDKMLP